MGVAAIVAGVVGYGRMASLQGDRRAIGLDPTLRDVHDPADRNLSHAMSGLLDGSVMIRTSFETKQPSATVLMVFDRSAHNRDAGFWLGPCVIGSLPASLDRCERGFHGSVRWARCGARPSR